MWVIYPIDNRGPQSLPPKEFTSIPPSVYWMTGNPLIDKIKNENPSVLSLKEDWGNSNLGFQSLTSMTPRSRLLQMAQKLKEKWRVLCDLTLWEKTLHFLSDARDSPNSGTQKLRQSTQRRKVWLEKCYKHQIFWLSRFGECPFQPQHFPIFVQKEQLSTKNREALNSHILKTSWALGLGCNLPPPPPLLQATHWTRTSKSNFQETFQDGSKEQNPKAPTTTEPVLVPFPPHQKTTLC